MITLNPVTTPEDLRTVADAPRPKSPRWQLGDPVQVGRVRWIVRLLQGEYVELEASNARCGMWWSTTLDKLPAKVAG